MQINDIDIIVYILIKIFNIRLKKYYKAVSISIKHVLLLNNDVVFSQ